MGPAGTRYVQEVRPGSGPHTLEADAETLSVILTRTQCLGGGRWGRGSTIRSYPTLNTPPLTLNTPLPQGGPGGRGVLRIEVAEKIKNFAPKARIFFWSILAQNVQK